MGAWTQEDSQEDAPCRRGPTDLPLSLHYFSTFLGREEGAYQLNFIRFLIFSYSKM